ncbi:adhesion G protein-coupled receptor E3-like isoform X2 [Polypterus senegalus]|uniref:adhesion G protein-coupled receptor E3-like isoform X2 n=1 Tax=Polypterus senegalus TaxID=55291 RepID=UPI0019623CEF|nr:adhesion G protein-coupled receptor E3-like isoform X2 [Polypterus senegalus]
MNLKREQKWALLLWLLSLVLPTFSKDHGCEEEFFEKVAQCNSRPASGSGDGLVQCATNVSCQVSTQITLDVDECQLFPGLCGSNAKCTNTESGYYCSCHQDYLPSTGTKWIVNKTQCQEIQVKNFKGDCELSNPKNTSTPELCFLLNFSQGLNQNFDGSISSTQQLQQVVSVLATPVRTTSLWKNLTVEQKALAADTYLKNAEKAVLSLVDKSVGQPRTKVTTENLAVDVLRIPFNETLLDTTEVLEAGENKLEVEVRSLFEDKSKGFSMISLLSFSGMESIFNRNFLGNANLSQVVAVALDSGHPRNLSQPIKIYFSHKKHQRGHVQSFCVFWRFNGQVGSWSQEGCDIFNLDDNFTVCRCSHLSSFAVLMQMSESKKSEDPILSLINLILITTSLVCLTLAIVTFLFCRSIQKATKAIHLHLSLCLFVAHLLFLVGISRHSMKVLCSVIAGLLHYFYLACFVWMCLEGVQLFLLVRNLRVVKYSTRQGMRRRYLVLMGYGVPAVIVAVAAGTFSKGYGMDQFCWLSKENGFHWSFLGPICFIITVNIILFISILWILRSKLGDLNTDVSKVKDKRMLTFKAASHCFIMGCTWILGFFQEFIVFEYLFIIVNALQGPFIFLVHCVLNHQISAWTC